MVRNNQVKGIQTSGEVFCPQLFEQSTNGNIVSVGLDGVWDHGPESVRHRMQHFS